jgi:hypothetical protein
MTPLQKRVCDAFALAEQIGRTAELPRAIYPASSLFCAKQELKGQRECIRHAQLRSLHPPFQR